MAISSKSPAISPLGRVLGRISNCDRLAESAETMTKLEPQPQKREGKRESGKRKAESGKPKAESESRKRTIENRKSKIESLAPVLPEARRANLDFGATCGAGGHGLMSRKNRACCFPTVAQLSTLAMFCQFGAPKLAVPCKR